MYGTRINVNNSIQEYSHDDGEHGGARAIMEVLRKQDVTNRLVVVTRWASGIQLSSKRFAIIAKCTDELIAPRQTRTDDQTAPQIAPQGATRMTAPQIAPQGATRMTAPQITPQGTTRMTAPQITPQGTTRMTAPQITPQGATRMTAPQIAPQGATRMTAPQIAPQGTTRMMTPQSAPQGTTRMTAPQIAPQGTTRLTAPQIAPQGTTRSTPQRDEHRFDMHHNSHQHVAQPYEQQASPTDGTHSMVYDSPV